MVWLCVFVIASYWWWNPLYIYSGLYIYIYIYIAISGSWWDKFATAEKKCVLLVLVLIFLNLHVVNSRFPVYVSSTSQQSCLRTDQEAGDIHSASRNLKSIHKRLFVQCWIFPLHFCNFKSFTLVHVIAKNTPLSGNVQFLATSEV